MNTSKEYPELSVEDIVRQGKFIGDNSSIEIQEEGEGKVTTVERLRHIAGEFMEAQQVYELNGGRIESVDVADVLGDIAGKVRSVFLQVIEARQDLAKNDPTNQVPLDGATELIWAELYNVLPELLDHREGRKKAPEDYRVIVANNALKRILPLSSDLAPERTGMTETIEELATSNVSTVGSGSTISDLPDIRTAEIDALFIDEIPSQSGNRTGVDITALGTGAIETVGENTMAFIPSIGDEETGFELKVEDPEKSRVALLPLEEELPSIED